MAESAGVIRHEVADLLRRSAPTAHAERRAAITGLGTIAGRPQAGGAEHEAVVAALTTAVEDPDPRVRLRAIRGLARLPTSRAFEAVAHAVTDDAYVTREAAVRTLVHLDPDEGAQVLIAASGDTRAAVRCAALIGLRTVRVIDQGVLDALVTGLTDMDASVQGTAMASLRRLATRNRQLAAAVTESALQGLRADSPQQREISIELLRQLQVPGHRQRCQAALNDPDATMRQRAERSLRNG